MVLQLVPPLSMFFLMSTAVGSALWAAGIENKRDALIRQPEDVGNFHDEGDENDAVV